jgi:hypothetical protein
VAGGEYRAAILVGKDGCFKRVYLTRDLDDVLFIVADEGAENGYIGHYIRNHECLHGLARYLADAFAGNERVTPIGFCHLHGKAHHKAAQKKREIFLVDGVAHYLLDMRKGDDMYLHDLELDSMILIKDQEQYTFTVKPGSVNDMRFQLLLHSSPNEDQPNDGVATGVENLYSSAQIWVNNKRLYVTGAPQNSSLAIYSVSGLCIAAPSPLLQTPCIIDLSYLPTGIYVVRLNTQVFKFVCE